MKGQRWDEELKARWEDGDCLTNVSSGVEPRPFSSADFIRLWLVLSVLWVQIFITELVGKRPSHDMHALGYKLEPFEM